MDSKKENLKDFIFTPDKAYKIYPDISPEAARQKIWRLKKKLKKPTGGVLLASEYAQLHGITLDQVHKLL